MKRASLLTGMYFHSDAFWSLPFRVLAPQQTLPYMGKFRRQLMASGFKTPFSRSVRMSSNAGTFVREASVPAGAFQTPLLLSVLAKRPAMVPLAPTDRSLKSLRGSGIIIRG